MKEYGYILVIAVMGLLLLFRQCGSGGTATEQVVKIDTLIQKELVIDTFERVVTEFKYVVKYQHKHHYDTTMLVDTIIETNTKYVYYDSAYYYSDTIYWASDTDTTAILDYEIVTLGEMLSFAPRMQVSRKVERVIETKKVKSVLEIEPFIGAAVGDNRTTLAKGIGLKYKGIGATFLNSGELGNTYLLSYKIGL